MEMKFEQIQKQALKLIMSPQMQQAMHILQLPMMELSALIQQELTTNPLLEEVRLESEKPTEKEVGDSEEKEELDFKEDFKMLSALDDEWREHFRQSSSFRKWSEIDRQKREFAQASIPQAETLHEHLKRQLMMVIDSEEEKKFGEQIIGNIDENGYLKATPGELQTSTNASLDKIQHMIALLQTFHPIGVAARDLKECLLIQLRRLGKDGGPSTIIVEQYLDELAKKKYKQIAKKLKLPVEEVCRIAEFIATLEPKPGRMFITEPTRYVIPDIIIQKPGDKYVVIMNNDKVPMLRISNTYKELMNRSDTETDAKEYIKQKVRSGMLLVKNIHHRQRTIYRIAEEIVNRQKEFLDKGIMYLKPMPMASVASTLGVHESTVSRAIASKYVQTPQGVFQMKYFFSIGIADANGEAVSVTKIKNKIAEIIKNEDAKNPLTDQQLIGTLAKEGITLARRTVAKYRKDLNIPSTSHRRVYY